MKTTNKPTIYMTVDEWQQQMDKQFRDFMLQLEKLQHEEDIWAMQDNLWIWGEN